MTRSFSIRRAVAPDAEAVADVYLRSRHAAVPEIPPLVHDDDDVRFWLATVVMPSLDVWVAVRSSGEVAGNESVGDESGGDESLGDASGGHESGSHESVGDSIVGDGIVGMLVVDGPELDQLYTDPSANGLGIGSQFVDLAKREQPGGLELWTFATNGGARRFYERHGFVEVDRSADNEEGELAIRYSWVPAA